MSFGQLMTTEFADDVELVAMADTNRERAKAGLKFLGVSAEVHEDYHDMVARKDVDAVVVTTPDYLHEEPCVAAFKQKKHVLVDKPLAITGKGCLRVIEAAKRANALLYMGFNLRHDAVLKELKSLVVQNTFGKIYSIQAIEHYDGGRTYMARWNRLKKYSGGLFIHKGSHDFDIINWMMGEARPERVSCFGNVFTLNPKGLPFKPRPGVKPGPTCTACAYLKKCKDALPAIPQRRPAGAAGAVSMMYDEKASNLDGYHRDLCIYLSDKDTHDQGIGIVEYDNGATASHSEYFVTSLTNRRYLIEGTLGHGEGDLHANRVEVRPRWSQEIITHDIKRPVGGHGGADNHMCAEFIQCLKRGLRPSASGIDGAWSVAIGQACELSRAEKRMVRINEVLDVKSSLLKLKR